MEFTLGTQVGDDEGSQDDVDDVLSPQPPLSFVPLAAHFVKLSFNTDSVVLNPSSFALI